MIDRQRKTRERKSYFDALIRVEEEKEVRNESLRENKSSLTQKESETKEKKEGKEKRKKVPFASKPKVGSDRIGSDQFEGHPIAPWTLNSDSAVPRPFKRCIKLMPMPIRIRYINIICLFCFAFY